MARDRRRGMSGALLIALLLCAAVLGACGLPDGSTRQVPDEDVPYRLLSSESGAPTPPPPSEFPVAVPQVYYVNPDEQLIAQQLPVESRATIAVVDAVLEALESGPSEQDRSEGLASALGPGAGLRLINLVDGTARVAVTPSDRNPAADRLPLAVGQIVLSLTSVEGVHRVRLVEDDQPLSAPLPGGAQTSEPLTASDYSSLIATESSAPARR